MIPAGAAAEPDTDLAERFGATAAEDALEAAGRLLDGVALIPLDDVVLVAAETVRRRMVADGPWRSKP